ECRQNGRTALPDLGVERERQIIQTGRNVVQSLKRRARGGCREMTVNAHMCLRPALEIPVVDIEPVEETDAAHIRSPVNPRIERIDHAAHRRSVGGSQRAKNRPIDLLKADIGKRAVRANLEKAATVGVEHVRTTGSNGFVRYRAALIVHLREVEYRNGTGNEHCDINRTLKDDDRVCRLAGTLNNAAVREILKVAIVRAWCPLRNVVETGPMHPVRVACKLYQCEEIAPHAHLIGPWRAARQVCKLGRDADLEILRVIVFVDRDNVVAKLRKAPKRIIRCSIGRAVLAYVIPAKIGIVHLIDFLGRGGKYHNLPGKGPSRKIT